MLSRQAAKLGPFAFLPVKAIPALWSCWNSHFPNFPTVPKIAAKNIFRPFQQSCGGARGWRREKKRRGEENSPSGFKLELEVLGIEVVDADVAILTPAAVAAGGKGKSGMLLEAKNGKSGLTTPS